MVCENPLGFTEGAPTLHSNQVVDVAVHVARAEAMEPDDTISVHTHSETAFAVHVKRAVGAVLPASGPPELDSKQAFGEGDYLLDVVSRF
jgi:hypothetical protein